MVTVRPYGCASDDVCLAIVERAGCWLGTIEEWEGEIRYCHSRPYDTYNAIGLDEMKQIVKAMEELESK